MGRIGKKKENTPTTTAGPNNNTNSEVVTIKVESIEDVEALRKAVQNVCQYANPLGRLMEQFVDDVSNMDKEFEYWKKQSDMWNDKISQAERDNEESLSKIIGKINNIEETIRTQKSRINNLKSQIQKNETQMKSVLKN